MVKKLSIIASHDFQIMTSSLATHPTRVPLPQANGKVYLTRIDNCGKVVWSNSYERTNEYLEFKDIVVADDNTIYAYGST